MAQDITSFQLGNYKGESIDEYVQAIRPKIEELDSADLLPPDINSIILKHFVGCSVEIFRAHFSPKLIVEEDFLMKSLNLPMDTKHPNTFSHTCLTVIRKVIRGAYYGLIHIKQVQGRVNNRVCMLSCLSTKVRMKGRSITDVTSGKAKYCVLQTVSKLLIKL
jgi:hypothetical protein